MAGFRDELLGHKSNAEMQYVVALYDNIDLYDEYKTQPTNITNVHWRVYYQMLAQMIEKKGVKVVDEMAMTMFVEGQSEKLQKLYENAGGWYTIEEGKAIIESENIESYYRDVLRFSTILRLNDAGFNVEANWETYRKMTFQELSEAVSGAVDTIFADVDMGEDKVYDIKKDIKQMLIDADMGVNRGLPVSSKLLNSVVNGMSLGNISMVAGGSGVGKTFITLCQILPTTIDEKQPLLIMCNEEAMDKWQREIIIWIINNRLGGDFIKERFYQGAFTKEEWDLLNKATAWLDEMLEDGLVQFVNFSTFAMGKAIKLIRKYASQHGIKYYIIDTLKLDNDIGSNVSDLAWLQLQQNMVKLYNVIKPTAKNVHVWVTYQMNKSVKTRFLSQGDLGMSKNVADVVSTLILVRNVMETEKGTEAKSLKVKKANGGEVSLSEDYEYMVAFIDKNRQGSTANQVVWRVDKGRNIMKDVGFTRIAQDY